MSHIRAGLVALMVIAFTINGFADQSRLLVSDRSSTPQMVTPKPLPPGVQFQRLHLRLGEAGVTSLANAAPLYQATQLSGFYFPTDWRVFEGVPLLGEACLNRLVFIYYGTADNDGDMLIDADFVIYDFTGSECGTEGAQLASFTLQDLPVDPKFAFIVTVDFDPKVSLGNADHVYVALKFTDGALPLCDVGWLLAEGPGNSKGQWSQDRFHSPAPQGTCPTGGSGSCWFFGGYGGGNPYANFALELYGSYNVLFRVAAQDATPDSIRAWFDDEFADDLSKALFQRRYRLADLDEDGVGVFSLPFELGAHTIRVETLPFLHRQIDFNATSMDPCTPTIVGVDLKNGDLNGDNSVTDTDLRRVLLNFGLIGD